MKTQTALIFLIAVLVLMAGVQAVQLSVLTNAITGGAVSVGTSSAATTQATGSAATASILSQLPSQVGGCG